MTKSVSAVLASLALLAAGAAHAGDTAASLTAVKGEVLLAGGSGVSQGKAGVALKAGDRVAARSGSATIRYADGCLATIPAGAMATISGKSPCVGGPGLVHAGGAPAQIGLPKWPVGAYFAGAGVVVIVGAIIYGVSGAVSD